ncbi:MAG: cyclic nucleotide-binding domain-containing protein [Pseudomonadales bacterium]|nr:cyclic nucleotide-binding domain-containing protein [Pseudomonadales bacterium]
MKKYNLRALFSESGLFNGLTDEDLDIVEEIVLCRPINPGEYLFKEGAPYDGLYLICCGKVEVVKVGSSGREELLVVLERGQVFGEVALFLEEGKRVASAKGAEKGECYFFPIAVFNEFLNNDHPTAYRMVLSMAKILSKRLDRMNQEIVKLAENERKESKTDTKQDLTVLKEQLMSSWSF